MRIDLRVNDARIEQFLLNCRGRKRQAAIVADGGDGNATLASISRSAPIGLVTSPASNHNRRVRFRATDSASPIDPQMSTFRIALANVQFPSTPAESVTLAEQAIAAAAVEGAGVICFPECFVPGYRTIDRRVPPPDAQFLERAWSAIAAAAAQANVGVVLGTERVVDGGLLISALVINADGTIAGFQDKVQLDPSEEATYAPGSGRRRLSDRTADASASRSVTRAGAIPKPCAGQRGRAPRSCSIRTFTKPSRAAIGRRPSPIRRIRSTRRRPSAGPPRTRAISRR